MTFLAFIALLLPGLAWWAWLGKRDQDPFVSLAQILGVSLAIIILLAQAVYLVGGSFSLAGVWVTLAGFACLSAAGLLRKGMNLPRNYRIHLIIGTFVFGLAIAWRLYQSRELLLPNWVDSQHHYLIVRVFLEQRGLPDNLSPYLSMPFYYHYGFHAVTALFTALSGLEIGHAMLTLGQVLNAVIGLSIYALGKALWRDWRPALAAALLVSFVTRMPAYYLSWGRYTLTTGLIFLPLAMAMSLRMLREKRQVQDVATLSFLTAGVLLSHYFTAILLAFFMLFLAVEYFASRLQNFTPALMRFSQVPAGALLGLLMAAPWLHRVAQFSASSTGIDVNLPESISAIFNGSGEYIWQLLGPTNNHWLLPVAGVGLLIGLIQLRSISFSLWSLLIAILALPWSFILRPFRADHFAIILFLPVSLWVGWLFWQFGHLLAKHLKKHWVPIVLLVLLVGGWIAWSVPKGRRIINPVTVLVTEEDMAALTWVKENTPEDARFYINTTHWLSNVYRGVDGGGWLLPLTGRWALVPTVFYGFSPDTTQSQQIRQWGEDAAQIETCSDDFWALIQEADLDWIYLREGVGRLQPAGLQNCKGIEQVITHGSVFIYHIQ